MNTEEAEEKPRNLVALGKQWQEEIQLARKYTEKWHRSWRKILKRLKDEREEERDGEQRRLNLFTAEYLTKRAVLYGKTPTVTSSRRWKDQDDDVGRVAAEIQGRHLNADAADGGDGYEAALGYALEDRLIGGMGQARVRYEVETEEVGNGVDEVERDTELQAMGHPAMPMAADSMALAGGLYAKPARGSVGNDGAYAGDGTLRGAGEGEASPVERKTYECVKVDYCFWQDFLYSPARRWEAVRWVGFKNELGKKAGRKRFGAKFDAVPMDSTKNDDEKKERESEPPWGRAVVWEIWDKDEKEVVWVTEGGVVLDVKADPYELKDFFPCPRPFFGLITSDELIPRPDFCLAEDLYKDIDELSTRIHLLVTAMRVVGVYDQSVLALEQLMTNTRENTMVPVRNWAALREKGGLAGALEFVPIQEVAATILGLSQERESLKAQLYEVTGMSDILRGQGGASAVTATEQQIKAQFGSARLQTIQADFARFATSLQKLKAELVAKHMDAEEIIRQSNILFTPDAEFAQQAVELLKSQSENFRVEVQPEALAMADFAALKDERMEVIAAVGQFIGAVTPLLQAMPMVAPAMVEVLKWLLASLRGASSIEGVLDQAIQKAEQEAERARQNPQQAPPDPKLISQQMKGQQDLQKVEAEKQARLQEIAAETQAHAQQEATQRQENVMEHAQKAVLTNALKPPERQDGGKP